MAVTVAAAAALANNPMSKGVLQYMTEEPNLINLMPFERVTGSAHTYAKDGVLPDAGFRDVNTAYTESAGTFVRETVPLSILGGDVKVDRAQIAMQGEGALGDLRVEATRQKALSVRRAFHNGFINGNKTNTPVEFEGLKRQLTGSAVVSAGTNGLAINGATDADRQNFLDKLDELIASVKGTPTALFMNRQALAKLKTAQRRLNGTNEGVAMFGVTLPAYANIPCFDIGDTAAGTQIIGNNETKGSANNATSIYAVRFSQGDGTFGVTNGGIKTEDLGMQADASYLTSIEWLCAVAVVTGSAARLEGVLAN